MICSSQEAGQEALMKLLIRESANLLALGANRQLLGDGGRRTQVFSPAGGGFWQISPAWSPSSGSHQNHMQLL